MKQQSNMAAIKCMDNILALPTSIILMQGLPVKSSPDSPEKILSFEVIRTNLCENKYKSFKEWVEDCRNYLKACRENNNDDRIVKLALWHLQMKFGKFLHKSMIAMPAEWGKQIITYKMKIDNMLRSAPPAIEKDMPLIQMNTQSTSIDLHCLSYMEKNTDKLTSPTQLMTALCILQENPVGIDINQNPLKIDVKTIQHPTLSKLYNYMNTIVPHQKNDPPVQHRQGNIRR